MWGVGFWVLGFGFEVWGLGNRGQGCGFGVSPLDEASNPVLSVHQALFVQEHLPTKEKIFIHDLLVRIHFIVEII